MPNYTATFKYIKVWDETIAAASLAEAEVIAKQKAQAENNSLDINEREEVVFVDVTKRNTIQD